MHQALYFALPEKLHSTANNESCGLALCAVRFHCRRTVTEQVCFDRLYFGTSGVIFRTERSGSDAWYVAAQTHVTGAGAGPLTVECSVESPDGETVACGHGAPGGMLRVPVEHPALWQGRRAPKTKDAFCIRAWIWRI